ncbi:DDE-type integrase/transposase/recombinase [Gallaecimonas mangrovi]|uniref:DDE-type integrase/transposase/recombinase n=1 Tax=Gallaecimonas mangrovi TaxID=2291597 RepID=UPI0021F6E5DD|nr:DDE-type integrase/transposase/recombinase [Gallaecimonas mangrovi]
MFLAVIVDLWSRKIIGWALHEKLNAELSTVALYKAIKQRKPKPGLILHTDRALNSGESDAEMAQSIWYSP